MLESLLAVFRLAVKVEALGEWRGMLEDLRHREFPAPAEEEFLWLEGEIADREYEIKWLLMEEI